MPPFDFRTSQIQTKQIIATGSFDGLGTNSQIAIYPIEAEGSPANQGEISAGLLAQLDATDVFLFVSGGIGEKGDSTRAITVFGGDIHISGNMTIDGSGGGGGGGTTFRPTSANLETPIITGTIDDVIITDVDGLSFGSIHPFIHFQVIDSVETAIVLVPIVYPVNPMPDRFGMNLQIFTGDNPPVAFQASIGFMNETNSKAWQVFHSIPTGSVYGPAMKILEVDTGVVGAQWEWPSLSGSNSLDIQALVEKVTPFEAIPQVKIDCDVGGFQSIQGRVHSIAYPLGSTSGTLNSGWEGDDWHHPAIICIFPTYIGELNVFFAVEFTPHIKDR